MKVCSACKRCFDDTAESCVEFGHPLLPDPSSGHRLMVTGYSLDQLLVASNKTDVYLARRLDCDKQCIIKVVSANSEDGEAFLRDAGLAAGVFDARVADIYEAGTLESGRFFVVEEFDDGQTLRNLLSTTGAPDLLASIRTVEQVAEALHALHLAGLTHGAVRPDNILVNFDEEGRPAIKLSGIDLGGIVTRNIISNKFVIDSALDSIRYFAPEQCSGTPACPQTDVYSLGVILYELLAGSPPFDAPKAVALMDMHRTHRAPEVMIDDLDLRMLVAHSLSESLQKQPSFRQSSADLLARQMRHIEQLATHVSTPPPAVTLPVTPPIPPRAVINRPSDPHIPAFEPVRGDSCGTAYARAVEASPDVEHEPAEPIFEPTAWHENVDQLPAIIELATEPERTEYFAGKAAPESAPETSGYIDISDVELPIHKASPLAERRHRLKHWKRSQVPAEVHRSVASAEPDSDSETELIARVGSSSIAFDHSNPIGDVKAEPTVMPKLIEWDQPDDVPPMDLAEPGSPFEPFAFDQDLSAASEGSPEIPVTSNRHLIKWDQPEDDIPSIEDVIEARFEVSAPDVRAINFRSEDSEVVAAIQSRLIAEGDVSREIEYPEAAIGSAASGSIDLDFVPTILGERGRHEDARPRPQFASILDAYEPPHTPRSIPYRSIGIGALLMAVAAVIGLGGEPLWQYFTSSEPGHSVAERPTREMQPIEPTQSAMVEPPIPETRSRRDFVLENPVYKGSATGAEQPRPDASKSRQRAQPRRETVTNKTQRADSSQFEPSTLVITYGSGKVQSDNSAQRNSRASEPRSPAKKPAGETRPRIVANPR